MNVRRKAGLLFTCRLGPDSAHQAPNPPAPRPSGTPLRVPFASNSIEHPEVVELKPPNQ